MGRLVQGIQRQPPLAVGDRLARPPGRGQLGGQPVERDLEFAAQPGGRVALPVVEAGAVAQPKPGQQVAAVQRHRLAQRADRGRSRRCRGHQPPEAVDVDRVVVELQPHRRAVSLQPAPAQRRPQRRQRAPKRGPAPLRLQLRPQQIDQRIAALRPVQAQHSHQRRGLARVHRQRRAVHPHPRRPQQFNHERHCGEYASAAVTNQVSPPTS